MTDDSARLKRRWYEAGSLLRMVDPREFMRQLEAMEAIAVVSAMPKAERRKILRRRSPEVVN